MDSLAVPWRAQLDARSRRDDTRLRGYSTTVANILADC
jgi:hypothetical protein